MYLTKQSTVSNNYNKFVLAFGNIPIIIYAMFENDFLLFSAIDENKSNNFL